MSSVQENLSALGGQMSLKNNHLYNFSDLPKGTRAEGKFKLPPLLLSVPVWVGQLHKRMWLLKPQGLPSLQASSPRAPGNSRQGMFVPYILTADSTSSQIPSSRQGPQVCLDLKK